METTLKILDNRAYIAIEKAHATFDLRMLLMPWLRFKAVVTFKPAPLLYGTRTTVKRTFYGDEHNCTYKQCLNGHVKDILLDRIRGYENLISKIEGEWKKRYVKVYLYGRDEKKNFDILHRCYYDGQLNGDRVSDPIIDTIDQFKTLHYKTTNNRLIVFDPTLLSQAAVNK